MATKPKSKGTRVKRGEKATEIGKWRRVKRIPLSKQKAPWRPK